MKKIVLISLGLLILVFGCNLEDENADTGQSEVVEFNGEISQSIVGSPDTVSRNITNVRNSSDPQARWFTDGGPNGRLYVYTSSDINTGSTSDNYPMNKTYVYSWEPGENGFTDHGSIANESGFSWASHVNHLWAPDCYFINGDYILFLPMIKSGTSNDSRIGIARSDRPDGGFVPFSSSYIGMYKAKPTVEIKNNCYASDPSVCKETGTGKYYMFYCDGDWNTPEKGGIAYCRLVERADGNFNGASYGRVTFTDLPTEWLNDSDLYMEGPSVTSNYYGSGCQYYMVFSVKHDNNRQQVLAYATSDSIKGPWKYRGILMDSFDEEWTNHGSIAYYGHPLALMLFYHYGVNTTSGGQVVDNKRQACVKRIPFNSDGTISTVTHDGNH